MSEGNANCGSDHPNRTQRPSRPHGTPSTQKQVAPSNGNGYDITVAAGTGFGVGLGTSILALGDDDSIQVGTLGLTVASNCWMATGPGNSNGWSPTVPTFLANPSTGVYCWTDLNPTATGSGNIYYGESGTVGTATDNMPASMLSRVGLLGLSNPKVDLTGLGLTGCFQLASGDVLDFVVLPSGTTSHTWTALTIPAGPVFFNGFEFHVQSAIFATNLNSFVGLGALTSNGLKCTTGDV